jgi:hypothetical protein
MPTKKTRANKVRKPRAQKSQPSSTPSVVEEPVVAEPVVAEPVVAETVVAETVVAETVVESVVAQSAGGKKRRGKKSKVVPEVVSTETVETPVEVVQTETATTETATTETATTTVQQTAGGKRVRSFKVMLPGGENYEGRFTGLTPYQAANKALSKYYRETSKPKKKIRFSIRESTRGSKRNVYTYNGQREKLLTPVEYSIKDGRTIVKRFKNRLVKIKKSELQTVEV